MSASYRRLLRVTARLGSPVIVPDPLHLDGLLAQIVYRRRGGRAITRDDPIEECGTELDGALPVPSVYHLGHRVWLCSAGELSEDAEAIRLHVTQRPDGEDVERYKRSFSRRAGLRRDRLDELTGHVAASISWTAIGSRREVRKALHLVDSIGSLRRHGYGAVLDWSVEVLDEAPAQPELVWLAGGAARRHLPRTWTDARGSRGWGATRWPYWHPDLQDACVAVGQRMTLTPEAVVACRRAIS